MLVTSLYRILAVYLHMGFALCQAQTCSNLTAETCVSCVNQPLKLECGPGEVVTGFVMAGFRDPARKDLTCGYHTGDCLGEPAPLFVEIVSCLWSRQSCTFTLNVNHMARYDKCPQDYKPAYLTASDIKCVPEHSLHHLCQSKHQVICVQPQTSGFLLSPDFPKPYGQRAGREGGCTITIATAQGLGIHLQSAYMDIQEQQECEDDYIQITWDDHMVSHDIRHCGTDSLNVHVMSQLAVVTFVFVSNSQTNQGFALNYTAFPVPPSTEQSLTLSSKADAEITEQASMTSYLVTQTSKPSLNWSTVYLILCILLFTLLMAAIATFGLIFYCTRKSYITAIKQVRSEQQYRTVPDQDLFDEEGFSSTLGSV